MYWKFWMRIPYFNIFLHKIITKRYIKHRDVRLSAGNLVGQVALIWAMCVVWRCSGIREVKGSQNNFSNVVPALLHHSPPPPPLLHSLPLEQDFLGCFFVKMTGPNRINKAPIFTWVLAGWSHLHTYQHAALHWRLVESWHLTRWGRALRLWKEVMVI